MYKIHTLYRKSRNINSDCKNPYIHPFTHRRTFPPRMVGSGVVPLFFFFSDGSRVVVVGTTLFDGRSCPCK